LPVLSFDDFDDSTPSHPIADHASTADAAAGGTAEFGTATALMVRSCNRIGMQASPPPSFSSWFWRR
jgi:hypothetical protein